MSTRCCGKPASGVGDRWYEVLIAAQDGTIKAENAPEGGAMFTVTFYKGVI